MPRRRESPVVGVVGAGSVGLAVAGVLGRAGHEVRIWNRSEARLAMVRQTAGINVSKDGIDWVTQVGIETRLAELANTCQVLILTTTADAHEDLIMELRPWLDGGHCIFLLPGRTGGALEAGRLLGRRLFAEGLLLGEASSSPFACRSVGARVTILAEKETLSMAAFPGKNGMRLFAIIKSLFPNVQLQSNVLSTSFENIGAMFHPVTTLVNAAMIDRKESFYFYRGLSPRIMALIERLDSERREAAYAYGIPSLSVTEWIKGVYPYTSGVSLHELMANCPAYSEINSPESLDSRYLLEDVSTGLVPLHHLGNARGVSMELTRSIVDFCSFLLEKAFWSEGRSLASMGLKGLERDEILDYVDQGWP